MFYQTTILAKSNTTNIRHYNSIVRRISIYTRKSIHWRGTLVKSTQGSKIIRFHMESGLAKSFFSIDKPYYRKNY